MSDILKFIESYKREEIAAAKAKHPLSALKEAAFSADPVRPFAKMINARLKKGRPALIAEIKKASPSRGLIRADFDPAGQAKAYADGGACCLSVLTDSPSFQGSAEDLRAARAACALPVLRKDFIFDPYQIYQSRLMGADCILIIMAALDIDCARECEKIAHALSMDAILEVHNEAELDKALALSSPLIGINNRDLRSFETRLETCEALAPRVPPDRTVIAESGLHTAEDVLRMNAVGVQCFLVGESLMRAGGNLHQAMRPFVLGSGEDRHGVNGG